MQQDTGLVHGGQPPPLAHDYSAPANPLGPPYFFQEVLEECTNRRPYLHYPPPDYRELREAIASFHGIDSREIVVINGSAEALALLPLLLRAERLVVVEPCFGDHGVQAKMQGIRLDRVMVWFDGSKIRLPDPSELVHLAGAGSIVVLSRPNNPIGYVVSSHYVYEAAAFLHRGGSILLLDEAFIDLTPATRPADLEDGLVIVRSFTKTFALPGLRLGYIYSEPRIATRIRHSIQAWPVGGLEACVYTRLLLSEKSKWYLSRARLLVAEEVPRVAAALENLGLLVYPSRAPFLLIRHDNRPNPLLLRQLIGLGIYVRDASSFYGLDERFSRISLRTPGENDVLLRAFEKALARRDA